MSQPTEVPRLCCRCLWGENEWAELLAVYWKQPIPERICLAKQASAFITNLVEGYRPKCSAMRTDEAACGHGARWFSPRPPPLPKEKR